MKKVWAGTLLLFIGALTGARALTAATPLAATDAGSFAEVAATAPADATHTATPPEVPSRLTKGVPLREAEAFSGGARVLVAHTLRSALLNEVAHLDNYTSAVALCDAFDLEAGTPTLAQMSSYDAVVVATDFFPADPVALGDRLADYVDMGGRVIVTLASWIPGWAVQGRFASAGYLPFMVADTTVSSSRTLGTFDADHPLMTGLTTLSTTLGSTPTVNGYTYVAARWNDGAPAVAVKGNVVAVNALPHTSFLSGQVAVLFSNAVAYLMTPRLRVLAAPSDDAPALFPQELLKDPKIGTVDYYDARSGTPTLAELSRYDAVVTWPNNGYADKNAMGDLLADYADLGGKVILGGFCWYTVGNSLGGRILSDHLSPLQVTTGANHYTSASLGAHLSHWLLYGVTAVSSPFRDYTALDPGATWVADWDDGEKFLAFKGNVVAVNGYLGDSGTVGDMPKIVRNAVRFLCLVYPEAHASVYQGSAPFTTTFTGSATGGQPPYTYRWDFGDGFSSTSQNPSHTYTAPGDYLVQLYVTDAAGHQEGAGFYVTVTAPLSLSASRTPASGTAPLPVAFSATPSGGTPPYTYDWNWGDGTAHGTTQNPSHTFPSAGTFTTILTVADGAGHTASQTLVTTVLPSLQAFAGGAPASGSIPLVVSFFGFATGGTPPYTYAWTFGDGGTGTGASASHTYTSAGNYSAVLTVTDGALRTATASPVAVTATVPPPVVTSLVKKSPPFKIVVNGSNLQSGIQVTINGTPWSGVSWKSTSKIVLTGSTLKTAVPPGTPTTFRFVNPDGGETTLIWQY